MGCGTASGTENPTKKSGKRVPSTLKLRRVVRMALRSLTRYSSAIPRTAGADLQLGELARTGCGNAGEYST